MENSIKFFVSDSKKVVSIPNIIDMRVTIEEYFYNSMYTQFCLKIKSITKELVNFLKENNTLTCFTEYENKTCIFIAEPIFMGDVNFKDIIIEFELLDYIINVKERNSMSYIITAEVSTSVEENLGGDISKVNASILSERNGNITFDVQGNFYNQKELTKKLCNSLIDAGFISFSISHSY